MSQVMFYAKPEAVNKEKHRTLRLDTSVANLNFAKQTNSVMLAGLEFQHAAKEYPIVFVQSANDQVFAAALLGVRTDENLFVNQDGRWDARYIPAFVRRYPFILAESGGEAGQMTVCMDVAHPGFNTEKGEPLFQENGEPTAILNNTVRFLQDCQEGYLRTTVFINRLRELDLFVTQAVKVEMTDGRSFTIQGLMTVDETKLLALDEKKAMELFRLGEMGWIYSHLISLSNVNRLAGLLAAREASVVTNG
ncbi:MAG: SapC family protein [Magnetococcales bacterium]|nr:SapC family protein [Magnetococcales bacterium]